MCFFCVFLFLFFGFLAFPSSKTQNFSADGYFHNFLETENRRKTSWKQTSPISKITQNFSDLNLQNAGSHFQTGVPSFNQANVFKNTLDGNIKNDSSTFSKMNTKNLIGSMNYDNLGTVLPNLYQDYESNFRSMSSDKESSTFSPPNISHDSGIFGSSTFSLSADLDCSSRSSSRDTGTSDNRLRNSMFPFMNVDAQTESSVSSFFQ